MKAKAHRILPLALIAAFLFCEEARASDCSYWLGLVKAGTTSEVLGRAPDESDPAVVLKGIECLLTLEGKGGMGTFQGATSFENSDPPPRQTAGVNALYYISYLYFQDWHHAGGVELQGAGDFRFSNARELEERAFASYKAWFREVKELGLAGARKAGLNPLDYSCVNWQLTKRGFSPKFDPVLCVAKLRNDGTFDDSDTSINSIGAKWSGTDQGESVELAVSEVRESKGTLHFTIRVRNIRSTPVFVAFKSETVSGGNEAFVEYDSANRTAKLNIGLLSLPNPYPYSARTNVRIKELAPNETLEQIFSIGFPIRETSPPSGRLKYMVRDGRFVVSEVEESLKEAGTADVSKIEIRVGYFEHVGLIRRFIDREGERSFNGTEFVGKGKLGQELSLVGLQKEAAIVVEVP
ncbi:MAG: hypothetical protein R2684_12155 [Pyrinomonadaceae bacterium]